MASKVVHVAQAQSMIKDIMVLITSMGTSKGTDFLYILPVSSLGTLGEIPMRRLKCTALDARSLI